MSLNIAANNSFQDYIPNIFSKYLTILDDYFKQKNQAPVRLTTNVLERGVSERESENSMVGIIK